MRPFLEDSSERRLRPGLSRRLSTGCTGAARMGGDAKGGRMRSGFHESLLWGPFTPLGVVAAAITAAIDQLSKLWLIFVTDLGTRGVVTLTPFLDLVLTWNR